MRLAILSGVLLAAGCTGAPTKDNTQAVNRVCGLDPCFYEREVRDFEVVDHTTLIVYVGAERCPYQIELHGTFCDLQYAPEIYFNGPSEVNVDSDRNIAAGSSSSRLNALRICRNDINIGVSGGVLTDNPTSNQQPAGGFRSPRSDCQISSVESLTDDELVELYVRRNVVPPPPPLGSGQIQVGEQKNANPTQGTSETPAGTQTPKPAEQGAAPATSQLEAAAAPR